jgi:predicted dehydrogenase
MMTVSTRDCLQVGLVGLGRHGLRYAAHLLEPIPGLKLTAVCRRDAKQGQAFADKHGLRFHQESGALIADPRVDAVVIVTPPASAVSIGLDAVRARKPVLIEKPLAPTQTEAKQLVDAAAAAQVPLMTAQTLRFDAAITALQEAVASVGVTRYVHCVNRVEARPELITPDAGYGGRGVLLEIGIHQFDLVRFLTGQEVADIFCVTDSEPGKPETRGFVHLHTTGGIPWVLDISRLSSSRTGRIEWIGARGQLVADWAMHRLSCLRSRTDVAVRSLEDRPTVVAALEAFAHALRRGVPMPISGVDGLRAVEIVEACYRSAREGRPVTLYTRHQSVASSSL